MKHSTRKKKRWGGNLHGLQDLVVQVRTLKDTLVRLEDEGKNLRDKLKLLNASHEGARCPLCDASLGEEGLCPSGRTYGRGDPAEA